MWYRRDPLVVSAFRRCGVSAFHRSTMSLLQRSAATASAPRVPADGLHASPQAGGGSGCGESRRRVGADCNGSALHSAAAVLPIRRDPAGRRFAPPVRAERCVARESCPQFIVESRQDRGMYPEEANCLVRNGRTNPSRRHWPRREPPRPILSLESGPKQLLRCGRRSVSEPGWDSHEGHQHG